MTPEERDKIRRLATVSIADMETQPASMYAEHVEVGDIKRLSAAVLAFVPPGDVQLPEGYRVDAVSQSMPLGMERKFGPVLVRADAGRDLGLALVAQADALSSQGEAGKGGR